MSGMGGRAGDGPLGHSTQGIPSCTGSVVFLNHSSASAPSQHPADVDGQTLARQKRKRTSPGDQAILEEAFNRDSKPDKAARLELVKRIALGEKEIQIWFQNRRQSSRRRSRPLLPHEIAQYQLARDGIAHRDLPGELKHGAESVALAHARASETIALVHAGSHLAASNDAPVKSGMSPQTGPAQPDVASSFNSSIPAGASSDMSSLSTDDWSREHQQSTPVPVSTVPTEVKQSALHERSSSTPVATLAPLGSSRMTVAKHYGDAEWARKKASSIVRLSMTSDGSAQIVTKDSTKPSPPRGATAPPPRYGTSDRYAGTLKDVASLPPSKSLTRSLSGRSRDSRAWEFWCDKDARDELKEKAEKDASGSAADAIDLLRSASGRVILGSIPLKRNSLLSRQASFSSLKRSKHDSQRPTTLQRSRTSLGRLQGKPSNAEAALSKDVPPLKYSESTSVYVPGNESDKENWSPGVKDHIIDSSKHEKSQTHQSQRHRNVALATTRSNGMSKSRPRCTEISLDDDNVDPDTDAELAAFMRGGAGGDSARSEAEDLDCVHGLLSLSQGNWR